MTDAAINDTNTTTRNEFNAVVEEVKRVGCVVRDDGRKNHVFLDHGNICQCGNVDLNAYRRVELR